jgi:hypothetical protein
MEWLGGEWRRTGGEIPLIFTGVKMKMKYKITKKITEKRIKEILEIKKTQGLTAENIIQEARNPKSSLHDLFEWDNTKAGHEYRLHQARVFINEIKIEIGDKELFAFENVEVRSISGDSEETAERQYKTMSEIISNEELRTQILNRAYQQLIFWKTQYKAYEELTPVVVAIDKVGKKIETKKQKIKVRAR